MPNICLQGCRRQTGERRYEADLCLRSSQSQRHPCKPCGSRGTPSQAITLLKFSFVISINNSYLCTKQKILMEYFRHRFLLSLIVILLSVILYPAEMHLAEIYAELSPIESMHSSDTLETTSTEQASDDTDPNSDARRRTTKHSRAKIAQAYRVENKREHTYTKPILSAYYTNENHIVKCTNQAATLYCRFRI